MNKVLEIVEDNKGRLSSSKIAYLLVTLVLCWLVIHMELNSRTNEIIVGTLAAMGAGVYGASRWTDNSNDKQRGNDVKETIK